MPQESWDFPVWLLKTDTIPAAIWMPSNQVRTSNPFRCSFLGRGHYPQVQALTCKQLITFLSGLLFCELYPTLFSLTLYSVSSTWKVLDFVWMPLLWSKPGNSSKLAYSFVSQLWGSSALRSLMSRNLRSLLHVLQFGCCGSKNKGYLDQPLTVITSMTEAACGSLYLIYN